MRAHLELLRPFAAGVFAVVLSMTASAPAQNDLFASEERSEEPPAAYTQSVGRPTPMQVIQEKAQARAAQRIARIAAKEWYGYSQARPRSSATPFTGMYGAQFQGFVAGRPSAHHVARPVIIVR